MLHDDFALNESMSYQYDRKIMSFQTQPLGSSGVTSRADSKTPAKAENPTRGTPAYLSNLHCAVTEANVCEQLAQDFLQYFKRFMRVCRS